ncbi:hypothetical protein B0H34DRAFT_858699 [Crassisporium funariophilum]|nr:hypothetical protein B0H34DRAFT_858699 [Crassisporium funariophilum]
MSVQLFNGAYDKEEEVAAAAMFAVTGKYSAGDRTLWSTQEDRAFITTMGLDVATFWKILEGPGGFGERWETMPIPQHDVSPAGAPQGHRQWCRRPGDHSALSGISHAQMSRYLEFAEEILHQTLLSLDEASISMPRSVPHFQHLSDLICTRHPLLEGAFGSIDGLSLPSQELDDPEIKNVKYNGWKTGHCINSVLAFPPEGVIISAALNAPGSWHDTDVPTARYA